MSIFAEKHKNINTMSKIKSINTLVNDALLIELEEAKDANALGFMARALVQATMPHKSMKGNEFERSNGAYTLTMLAPSKIGLPYGSIPRLLLAWITSEAVKTKERELILGGSLSEFMRKIDLVPTGGRWGTITRLKDQSKRLFSAHVYCNYINTDPGTGIIQDSGINFNVAETHNLWWVPKNLSQSTIFDSTVTLTQSFFDEIIEKPVPIDLRALKALRRSPMALDIYVWLTHRMSYLKRQTEIPWEALQMQFGADYAVGSQGKLDFKRAFLRQMKKVVMVYPEAKVSEGRMGLALSPSQTHIKPRLKKPYGS